MGGLVSGSFEVWEPTIQTRMSGLRYVGCLRKGEAMAIGSATRWNWEASRGYPLVIVYFLLWKITMFNGWITTISMAIFNSDLLDYQRVTMGFNINKLG